jgi:hypothetical protein
MWQDQERRRDHSGSSWNFRIWGGFLWIEDKPAMGHRLFFWSDNKSTCGVILFLPGSDRRFRHVKSLIEKLVADPTLREKHRRELRFPLERYYSDFGAFPEEKSN